MPNLNFNLQILDLTKAIATINPEDCEIIEMKPLEKSDNCVVVNGLDECLRNFTKQCVGNFTKGSPVTNLPVPCPESTTKWTDGCNKTKGNLNKPTFRSCSSNKDGLTPESFLKAICNYPPMFYSICVREENWTRGPQENKQGHFQTDIGNI